MAMIPTTQVAVVIILLAMAPGYITVVTWARNRTWKGPASDLRTIIQSLVLSAVIQSVLSPLTALWIVPVRDHLDSHPFRIVVWVLLTVIVVPILIGEVGAKITDIMFDPAKDRVSGFANFVNKLFPAPTPPTIWDWLFTNDRIPESGFLVLEFNDGTRVAGAFAAESMALTSPEPPGLFMEREWLLDQNGNIVTEVKATGGVLVTNIDEVRLIRILKSSQDTEGKRDGR